MEHAQSFSQAPATTATATAAEAEELFDQSLVDKLPRLITTMKPSRLVTLAVLVLSLLMLCHRQLLADEAVPGWYRNRQGESGVLYGYGSGASLEVARASALLDLIQQLIVDVSGSESARTSSSVELRDGKQSEVIIEQFKSRIKTSSSVNMLAGAEVDEQQVNDGAAYVRVRLKKRDFIATARRRIAEIDKRLAKLPGTDPPDTELTAAWASSLRAMIVPAIEREALAIMLGGQGVHDLPDMPVSSAELRQRLGGLVVPPLLQVKRQDADRAQRTYAALLTVADELGVKVAAHNSQAQKDEHKEEEASLLVASLKQNAESRALPNGWVKMTIKGVVTITTADGRALGSIEASATKTGVDEQLADRLAGEAFAEAMSQALKARLLPLIKNHDFDE